jgi:hypothetical protein
MGWPGYSGGGEAPHKTIEAIPGKGIAVRRHIPLGQYAKALMNLPGGVETNRRGVLQYELKGTCDPKHRGDRSWYYWPDADDTVLRALADELRPDLTLYGIPFSAPAFLPYPSSYGSRGGQRMSGAEWNTFNGICGHQHVPENDHGDPGAFPIARLVAFLGAGSASPVTRATQQVSRAVRRDPLVVDGVMGPNTIRQWQKVMGTPVDGVISRPSSLIARVQRSLKVIPDGYLGPVTWKAIQRRLGVSADGVPGPVTIKALQRRLNSGQF